MSPRLGGGRPWDWTGPFGARYTIRVSDTTPQGALDEYRAVISKVESRQSVVHLAHAIVVGIAGLAVGGAAVRLGIDLSPSNVGWAYGVGGVAAGLVAYAVVRALLAQRARRSERRHVEQLVAIGKRLRLDEPSGHWASWASSPAEGPR